MDSSELYKEHDEAVMNEITQQDDDISTISGFNWGAFAFTWIWGICNGATIETIKPFFVALIVLIIFPYIGWAAMIGAMVYIGINGNDWAWAGKDWQSVKRFKETQKSWNIAGIIYFCVGTILPLIIGFFFAGMGIIFGNVLNNANSQMRLTPGVAPISRLAKNPAIKNAKSGEEIAKYIVENNGGFTSESNKNIAKREIYKQNSVRVYMNTPEKEQYIYSYKKTGKKCQVSTKNCHVYKYKIDENNRITPVAKIYFGDDGKSKVINFGPKK